MRQRKAVSSSVEVEPWVGQPRTAVGELLCGGQRSRPLPVGVAVRRGVKNVVSYDGGPGGGRGFFPSWPAVSDFPV